MQNPSAGVPSLQCTDRASAVLHRARLTLGWTRARSVMPAWQGRARFLLSSNGRKEEVAGIVAAGDGGAHNGVGKTCRRGRGPKLRRGHHAAWVYSLCARARGIATDLLLERAAGLLLIAMLRKEARSAFAETSTALFGASWQDTT